MSKLNITCLVPTSDNATFLNSLGVSNKYINMFVTLTNSLNPNGDKSVLDLIRQFEYFQKFQNKFGNILAAYSRTIMYVNRYFTEHNELPAHSDTAVVEQIDKPSTNQRYQTILQQNRDFHSDVMYGNISLNEQKELVSEWVKNFETIINYLATNDPAVYQYISKTQYEALDKIYVSVLKRSRNRNIVDNEHPLSFRELVNGLNNPKIKFSFDDLVQIVTNYMYYNYHQYKNTLKNVDENTERTTQLVEQAKKYGLLFSQFAKPMIREKLGIGLPTFSLDLGADNIGIYKPDLSNEDGEHEFDDTEEGNLDETSMISREHWTNIATINLRKRLNARLRLLFERFRVEENPVTRFGTVNYHDGKEVYYKLIDAVHDVENSDDLVNVLKSYQFNAPFKKQLLEIIDNDVELKTHLFHAMKTSQNHYIVVNKNENGFRCFQSNAESVYDKTNRILLTLKARKHSHLVSYSKKSDGTIKAIAKQGYDRYLLYYRTLLTSIYNTMFEEKVNNSDTKFYYKDTVDGYTIYDPRTKAPVKPRDLYRFENSVTIGQIAAGLQESTIIENILNEDNVDFHKKNKDLTIAEFINSFLRELGCDLIAVDAKDMHNRIMHSFHYNPQLKRNCLSLKNFKDFISLFTTRNKSKDLFATLVKGDFEFKSLLVRNIYKTINHNIETDHTYSHYFDGASYQTYSPINYINNKTQEMHRMTELQKQEALENLKKDWYSGYFIANDCQWFNSWDRDFYSGGTTGSLDLGYFLRSGQMDWRKATHRAYMTAAMSAFFKSPHKKNEHLYLAPTLESKGTAYYISNLAYATAPRTDEFGRVVTDVSDRLVSVFAQELHRIKMVYEQALYKQTQIFDAFKNLVGDSNLSDSDIISYLQDRNAFATRFSAQLLNDYDKIVADYRQKSLSPSLKQIVGDFSAQNIAEEDREINADQSIHYIIDFSKPLNGATFHLLNEFRSVWEHERDSNIVLNESEQAIMNYINRYIYTSQAFNDLPYFDLVSADSFEECKDLRSMVSNWIYEMLQRKTDEFISGFSIGDLVKLTLSTDTVKAYNSYLKQLKDPKNADEKKKQEMQNLDKRVADIEQEAQQKVYHWLPNHYYANSQFLTMLAGDTALYKDVDTLTKRLPELSTGGTMVDTSAFSNVLKDVRPLVNKRFMVFEDLDNIIAHPQLADYLRKSAIREAFARINSLDVDEAAKETMRQNARNKADKLAEDYTKINGTDGQSIMSVEYLRQYLFQMGELTEAENEILKTIIDIYTVNDDSLPALLEQYQEQLANLDTALDINTKKTFSYALLYRKELDGDGKPILSKKPLQVKTADMFDLDPYSFIYFDENNHPHKDVNNLMYRLQNFMLSNNIHGLCADSALKVYQPHKTSIDTRVENQTVDSIISNLVERSTNDDYVVSFPAIYNIHAMETKSDFADLERVVGIQFQKLITEMLNENQQFTFKLGNQTINMNGIEMFNKIDDLYGNLYKLAAERLTEDIRDVIGDKYLNWNDNSFNMLSEKEIRQLSQILSKKLLQQLENSDSFSANTFSALMTDEHGNFNVPLASPSLYTQVQKLIISLVKNNIIGVELPGGDLIQVANIVNIKDTMRRVQQISLSKNDEQINSVLQIKLSDLDLSVRTTKFLQSLHLETVRDLVVQSKNSLDRLSKFNKTIMTELSELVNRFNLNFGMDVKKFDTYNNEIDQITSSDLNMEFEYAADGKTITGIKWMEVEIPFYLKDQMEEYLDANGVFKMNKIPDEMKEIIGYRIPTEGLCSIFPMKVKRFSNPNAGGNIKVPAIMTKISGSDFDIDKVYFVRNAFDKNGNYIQPSTDSIEGISNYLFLLYKTILLHPAMENERMKPQGFETIEKMSSFMGYLQQLKTQNISDDQKKNAAIAASQNDYEVTLDKFIDTRSPCDPIVQSDLHSRNQIAAQAIGIAAVHRQVHAFLRHYDVPVLSEMPIAIEGDQIAEAALPGRWLIRFDEEYCHDGVTKISDVLREILGASVDAAKKPLFGQLNFTLYTFDILCILARMGFTIEDISLIMQQPIVNEIIQNCELAAENSPTGYVNTTAVISSMLSEFKEADQIRKLPFNFTHERLITGIMTQTAKSPQQINLLGFFEYISRVADDCFELNSICRADSLTGNAWQNMYEYIAMMTNRYVFMQRVNEKGGSPFTNKVLEIFIDPKLNQTGIVPVSSSTQINKQSNKLLSIVNESQNFINFVMDIANIPQSPTYWQGLLQQLLMAVGATRISPKQVRDFMSAYHSYVYNLYRTRELDARGEEYQQSYYLGTKDGNIDNTFLDHFAHISAMFDQDYPTMFNAKDSLVLTRPVHLREKKSVNKFQILNLYYRERTPEFNNDFMTEWERMSYDNRSTDDGYTVKQFADELTDYVIMKNGFNINNNSFAKYIPYNITSRLTPEVLQNKALLAVAKTQLDPIDANNFIELYIRHNKHLIPRSPHVEVDNNPKEAVVPTAQTDYFINGHGILYKRVRQGGNLFRRICYLGAREIGLEYLPNKVDNGKNSDTATYFGYLNAWWAQSSNQNNAEQYSEEQTQEYYVNHIKHSVGLLFDYLHNVNNQNTKKSSELKQRLRDMGVMDIDTFDIDNTLLAEDLKDADKQFNTLVQEFCITK